MTLMLGKKNSSLLIILFALCLNGKAQTPTNYRSKLDSLRKKDSIHFRLTTELGGIAKVYSINFKKYWYTKNRRTYGFRFGFSKLSVAYYNHNNIIYGVKPKRFFSSSPPNLSINVFDPIYIVPLTFFHSIGNKNKWELDYGFTLSYSEGTTGQVFFSRLPEELYLKWSVGILRRFTFKKINNFSLCLGWNIQSMVDIGLTKSPLSQYSDNFKHHSYIVELYPKISIDYSF